MSFKKYFFLVIVPPEKPKIYEERGQEVRLKLGPYRIGDTVSLKCSATGGMYSLEYKDSPKPKYIFEN